MAQNTADTQTAARPAPPVLVAFAGWALPGFGYVVLGEKARGFTIMVTVLSMYIFGLLIAGVRVVDVPGYDKNGLEDRVDDQGLRLTLANSDYPNGHWAIFSSSFVAEIAAKPWYVGQVLAGPVNLVASAESVAMARQNVPNSHARIAEIGTLYTAVAGMLNLLAIIDSSSRAANPEEQEEEQGAQPAGESTR